MQVIKIILIIIDIIICLALIVLSMIQSKEDEGLTSTITGSSSSNFFEQNKGRTKEGKQKRWTIILGIAFAIVSIALAIVYPI
jgi:preprotein translocase subunit SecG